MAQVIWAEPALQDLDAIVDYIALEDPAPAKKLVRKSFEKTGQLLELPESGSKLVELKNTPYRRLSIKPILIYYQIKDSNALIVCVTREEREFSLKRILGSNI